MRKKALLALMLAMTLALSGCALIAKDEAVDAATPIITAGDTVITKAEVQSAVNSQLEYMAYMYSMYGSSYDVTDASNIASAQESAIQGLKEEVVLKRKIEEMNITLTEEEEADVAEHAQSDYDSDIESAKNYLLADSGLEGDELNAAAAEELTKLGISVDSYVESERLTKQKSKLKEEVVKDVQMTEDDLKAEYDSRVESAKETYGENASSYTAAVNNGSTIYYAPEGVRRVKQILTKFTDEDQAVIDAANTKVTEANTAVTTATSQQSDAQAILDAEEATEEEKTQAQADLDSANAALADAQAALESAQAELKAATDAAFANIDATADDILAQLAAGADWDTLMAEKNQDPGMQSGVTAEKGYAVSADMTSFDSAFVQAAMALEKIGDTSDKIRGESYGYYIIKYVADEPAGAIDLEQVRETLSTTVLNNKKNDFYDETLAKWVDEAGFKVDLNALKD